MRINRPCPRDGWQALVNNFVTADTTFLPRLLCITGTWYYWRWRNHRLINVRWRRARSRLIIAWLAGHRSVRLGQYSCLVCCQHVPWWAPISSSSCSSRWRICALVMRRVDVRTLQRVACYAIAHHRRRRLDKAINTLSTDVVISKRSKWQQHCGVQLTQLNIEQAFSVMPSPRLASSMQVGFYRAMLCISAVSAVMRCMSVCPSVCHVRWSCQIEWTYLRKFFTIW